MNGKDFRRIVTKTLHRPTGAAGTALHWAGRILGTMLLIGATAGIIMAFLFTIYVNRYIKPTLDMNLDDYSLDLTSFVYYTDPQTGEAKELETLYDTENRVWVNYEQIPQNLINATIAIEDQRFKSHHGVDWKRTIGAFGNMFLSLRSNFGGSTITQQLIKNLTNDKDVTVKRKIVEIFRALEFERNYTKEDIMEWYLNTIPLGQGCNGVNTAAQTYYGKSVSDLSLAECAALIGITNAPTLYNPYLNPEKNKERQELILEKMLELGMIDKDAHDAAVKQTLNFQNNKTKAQDSKQSYFVDQVINDVISDLVEQKGISKQIASKSIYQSGYKIYTTIDIGVQKIMDDVFTNEENFPKVRVNGPELPQAAMVVMDPYTGNIVGMVGGRGEKQGARTLNRATQSYRQPGSAIKPLTVYGPALDMGAITPYSVFDDSPMSVINGRAWPKNYDFRYRGRMTVLKAVEISDNAVAARVVDMITPEKAFSFASVNLGLSSLVRQQEKGGKIYSDVNIAPMSLGGLTKGLSVKDMTAAYCSFVNKGVYTKPRTYTKVVDSKGNVVLENKAESVAAMKEKTAYYMNYMLQNVVKQGTGTKAKLDNMAVAGKTGTTSDDNDRWFVGYTPYYVSSVWFGFDEPQEIKLEKSTNPALALWKMVMSKVHEGLEKKSFFEPEGLVKASYCMDSGLAPTQYCRMDPRGSRVATGIFYKDDVPSSPCTMHVQVNMDTSTGQLATPFCPAEFLKAISLLDLNRRFSIPGVVVEDEQYTIRIYGEENSGSGYRATAPANKSGAPQLNSFCTTHTQEWTPPVPETPETEEPEETEETEEPGETDEPIRSQLPYEEGPILTPTPSPAFED